MKYNKSLVLGKFNPPHLGHLYLIDEAINLSNEVNIMICWNPSQETLPNVRFDTINEIYKNNPKVKIHLINDQGLPQSDKECETKDEFYSYWVPLVKEKVNDLEVVFTSEDYGDDFAQYLGIKHHLVDKERIKYPVSATKVRNNPLKYWNFIPNNLKYNYVKRVAIMGPESVGKSTLTQLLAEHYDTNYLEEWGRVVYERNNNHLELEDFIKISKERAQKEENLLKSSNKIFFTDTEDLTTFIFSKMYYPNDWTNIKYYFDNQLLNFPKYDIYILLKPDCEKVQDGTRMFLETRWEHYNTIKQELIDRNLKFVEISGSWEERLLKSIEEINNHILIYNEN